MHSGTFQKTYVPSPTANQYCAGTVHSFAQFPNINKMFHCLSRSKIVPSFNIGIIIALIYCVYLKYKGEAENYSTPENVIVRRGIFITSALVYIQYKVRQLVVKMWGKNKKRTVVVRTYAQPNKLTQHWVNPTLAQPNKLTQPWVNSTSGQPHNLTQPPNNNPIPQPNNNPTTHHINPTIDATPNQTWDVTNKNGDIKAYVLEEGAAVGTEVRKANKNVAIDSQQKQEPLPTRSKTHGVIWASGGEEYDEDYDVYEHLDKVPVTMPPPLGPEDFMYYPSQLTVFGTENKGPLRPIDQKPNMRGDPDYDALSPKQQEKRDLDQYYEYQEKALAGTSKRKNQKPKIKTKVWTPTKPTPQLRTDFGAELKKTTQQHHEKARAMYNYESPDPITQDTYVPPEQKRDQDPPLKLTPPKRVLNPTPPTRVNITYQEGETVGESPQAHHPNFSAPPSVPPSGNNSLSLSFTQSSHSPVDNLLNKFKNTQFLPPTFPPMSLQNHAANSPFQPINSRASSPKTSTPNHTPPPIPKEEESRQESQYNRSASRNSSRHSRHGGSLSRNTCGSLNSSVYQAKIESLQEQVQTLLNQSAEKEDKLLRMESELEETKPTNRNKLKRPFRMRSLKVKDTRRKLTLKRKSPKLSSIDRNQ